MIHTQADNSQNSARPSTDDARTPSGPAKAVQENVAGLAADLTELAELQCELFMHDLSRLFSTSRVSAAVLIVGAVLAFSSIPVLLLGVGWLVIESTGVATSVGLIGTSLVIGAVPAAVFIWLGIQRFRSDFKTLNRSRLELSKNLVWFRQTMRRQTGTRENKY